MKTTDLSQPQNQGGRMPLEDVQKPSGAEDSRKQPEVQEKLLKNERTWLTNGFDMFECPPPKTENEV